MAGSVRSQVRGAAAGMDVDASGFMASLAAALKAIETRTEAQLWVLGLRVQNNARILAPVDTGRLRSSIQATKGSDGVGPFVDVGTNVEYAAYVEFGTRHQSPQPYLRPALAVAAQQFAAGMVTGSKGGLA